MKTLAITAAALLIAAPTFAGNLDTFVAPEPIVVEEAPAGGSNAAWLVPVLAIAVIAAAVAASN